MALTTHIRRFSCALLAALLALAAGAAESSAATKIKGANAVDTDDDGSVDGFNVTFSAKLLGKARSGGSLPFRVSGYRVTAVGKPRGRRVRVRVAEAPGCDLGAKPKISFRGGLLTDARKRRLRRSRIDLGRRDRRAPRITCAVTGDRDRDGHIDSVVLTYSRPVRGPAASGAGPFRVDRYTITSVGRPHARKLALRLKEKASFDTGNVPAVFYRRPRRASQGVRATARRRGAPSSTTYNDTRDKAFPRFVSARTEDFNQNGLVDGVVARFSEPVKADPRAIAVAGARVVSVAKRGRDSFAAAIAEGPLRSDARPDVAFGTASKVVRDLADNVARRTSVVAQDGATPVITAVRTLDRGGAAGRLDTLVLTYSEPVSHAADSDGSYPFGVTGYAISSAAGSAGTSLDLLVAEGALLDSGTRPPVGYTRGTGAPVRDAAGNEAASQVFAGASDGIAPRLLGATTLDADADGRVDRVRYTFTEPIGSAQRACSLGCGFTAAGLSAVTALTAAGSSVEVTVAEGALNGGIEPVASYSPASGGAVRDPSGNAAPAASLGSADGAAPVAVDAYTADADSDARIDRLLVTFSEPLSYPGDSVGQTSFTATGYTVSRVDTAVGASLTMRLAEASAPDTGSAPAVGYNGQGGVALRDANGVEHANVSWPNLTRDAVAPTFVGGRTADLNADPGDEVGKVDAVELVYSEEVEGTPLISDFSVPGRTIDAIDFSPDSVKIKVTEAAGFDTDTTVPVTYTPGDLHDVAEGPGDLADPAPAADTTAVDGAEPAIVAAQTEDTAPGPNGKVDHVQMTFSEPVAYTAGPTFPLTLAAPGLDLSGLVVDGPIQLTATVLEPPDPNGGAKPEITVSDTARITDLAAIPNEARPGPFTATADGVKPALVSARFGEAVSGACGTSAVDSIVDCIRATWSEPIVQPATHSALSLTGFTLNNLLTPPGDTDIDAAFTPPGSTPDRDRVGNLDYTGGGADEIVDLAGNPSITPGNAFVGPVCSDGGSEPNDTQDPNPSGGNPLLTDPQGIEAICAGDVDWYRLTVSASPVDLVVDPGGGLSLTAGLFTADGAPVAGASGSSGPAGGIVVLQKSGLAPGTYWVRVTGAGAQEGDYCVDITHTAGEECNDGDFLPN